MGRRMTCPACGSRTSSIVAAFEEGDPCPVCGLPHAAASAVVAIKAREANSEVTQRAVHAELRAAAAENELRRAQWRLECVTQAIVSEPDGWVPFTEPRAPEILMSPDAEVASYLPDLG